MNKVISVFFYLVIIFFLASCGDKDDKDSFCPTIYDNITWSSYGHFDLNNEGRDSTARRIVSECDWHVQGNNNGGVGSTLQVASENEEVIFVWAYNDFYGFDLIEGWEGQTDRGIMIGDHSTEFAGAYPEFLFTSGNFASYVGNNSRVYAYFDDDGFLTRIYVGYYLR